MRGAIGLRRHRVHERPSYPFHPGHTLRTFSFFICSHIFFQIKAMVVAARDGGEKGEDKIGVYAKGLMEKVDVACKDPTSKMEDLSAK